MARLDELHAMLDGIDTDDCVEWPHGRSPQGYGMVWIAERKVMVGAHRVACRSAHGDPPGDARYAIHACGNRPCVNPRHLRWGTPSDNMADAVDHGTTTRGTRNHHAKLTPDDVRAIRAARGTVSGAELARRYGVTPATVCDIHFRRSWRHL